MRCHQSKILITGAASFVGFHLLKKLLDESYQVIRIDNLNDYYDPSLKQSRLEILGKHNNFNFQKVDLKDKAEVDNIFETYQPTDVINLAAQARVWYSIENPYAYVDSNLTGFMNILEAVETTLWNIYSMLLQVQSMAVI
jgi:UDP-glucuronate 4-epimerase